MVESKGSQTSSIALICPQDHPCQVSCLTQQVCSVNCPDAWKSTVLGQKSTVVQIHSNFKFFGQHQHFEVIFIIWSMVDHDSSRNAPNSSKVKICQIRVSLWEVNWTLTKHNFNMIHQLFPNQNTLWRKFNSLQLWN